MLQRFARPLEIALGVLFIASAALKALDVYGFAVQIGAYGVIRDPLILPQLAYAMIALEAALGAALLGGYAFGGATIFVTAGLLIGLTGLIAYAWVFKDLADCGCFGSYIKMGPGASIAKNVVLLAMAGLVWYGQRKKQQPEPSVEETAPTLATAERNANRKFILASIGVAIVAGAIAMGKPAPPNKSTPATSTQTNGTKPAGKFAEFVPEMGGAPVPLAQGEFFLVMLSASCDHCRAVTASLNDLISIEGVPQIVALLMGTDDEMKDYMAATAPQFPIQVIDTLKFMSMLETNAPPDFYIIRDGAVVRHMEAEEPGYDELLAFATGKDAPPAEAQK
ncbi:MAG: hypothetical protein IT367_10035 [Candidatus Hydrogenedentes bacterium]|nr:hypothetical protein [Candidatus Hydrogenedentota bacterium]